MYTRYCILVQILIFFYCIGLTGLIAQNGHLEVEYAGTDLPGVSISILDTSMYNDNSVGLSINVENPHIGTGMTIYGTHQGWSTYVSKYESVDEYFFLRGNNTNVSGPINQDSVMVWGSEVYVSSSNSSPYFTHGIKSGVFNYQEQSDTINWNEIANPAGYFSSNAGQGIVGESMGGYNSIFAGDDEEYLKAAQGVVGISQSGSGVNIGVMGYAANGYRNDGVVGMVDGDINTDSSGAAIVGVNFMGDTLNFYAGEFFGRVSVDGDLDITGNLSKQGGSFKIDHPDDPANKFLSHSFVESPDMMNIYNGIVKTDVQGIAKVILPDYFNSLNKDYRYQLTPIGNFAQVIIKEEVINNEFVIQSDKPLINISWQVTGIRNDVWAKNHRIPTVENKMETERGKFLYPAGFDSDHSLKGQRKSELLKYKKPKNSYHSNAIELEPNSKFKKIKNQ